MSTVDRMLAGAIGGLAGGMMMSAAMMAAKQAEIIEKPLPLKVEQKIEGRLGLAHTTDPDEEKALAQAGHLAFSALLGAGYGLIDPNDALPTVAKGMMYGVGVYALNLVGLGPAVGLTQGPWNEEAMTVGRRVMMHAMYGAVTAMVAEEMEEKLR